MAVAVAAMAIAPALVAAQSVRGVVTEAASASPLAGVVITLLDNTGAPVGRALSNDDGEYRIVAPGAGTYRLRALRIGFAPVNSAPVTLVSGGDAVHPLALTSIPFSLDTVRIASQGTCEARQDSAMQSFRIWEQARAALMAAEITERARAINARIINYHRALDARGEIILRQNTRVTTGVTRTPWRAIGIDSLRRAGYVVQERDGSTSYFAPDLGILLSQDFLVDHCMRLSAGTDASRIGIAFEPTRARRDVPEIEGTIWLDRKTSELRLMEFRYVNVTSHQRAGNSGGELHFARMKNGAWVISGWNIRMPLIQTEMRRRYGGFVDRIVSVVEIQIQGGELAMATRGRDTLWARPPLHLSGVVTDSASRRPLANSLVAIRGTTLSTRTDSLGRFTIPDVLPGEYTVEVATPQLQRLGVSYAVPFVFLNSASTLVARLPPASVVTRRVCADTTAGILAGAVFARRGDTTIHNARVVAEWSERGNSSSVPRTRWVEARPNARGRYVLCGLPIGVAVDLHTDSDSGSAAPARLTIGATDRIASMDFRLDEETRVVTLADTVVSAGDGRALAGVEIVIPALSRGTVTDSAGAFRLPRVPAGPHQVTLRRAGYTTITESIMVASSTTSERKFAISTVPGQTAAEVQASAEQRVDERRPTGAGRFLTREQLERFGRQPLTAAMTHLPGVDIARGRSQQGWMVSNRVRPSGQSTLYERSAEAAVENLRREGIYVPDRNEANEGMPVACHVQVYIDGTLMNHGRPTPPYDLSVHSAENVESLEWYSNPATIPARYNSYEAKCGVLVIRLRR